MNFEFQKFVGAGNDFVFIDSSKAPEKAHRPDLAKQLCDRTWGVGADGLVIMEHLGDQNFRWDFYNNDGSNAEMCGNAARCAVLYSYMNYNFENCSIESAIGGLSGVIENNQPKVSWKLASSTLEEKSITIDSNKTVVGQFIDTGVPHFVIDTDQTPLNGRDCVLIQDHNEFAPRQTNVTLLHTKNGQYFTKSFERGVRDFTLACGTGVIATAFVLQARGVNGPYQLTAPGGTLQVEINSNSISLSGPTAQTMVGNFQHKEG